MAKYKLMILLFFVGLISVSCSGIPNQPVLPGNSNSELSESLGDIPSDLARASGNEMQYPGLMGAWKIQVNLENLSFDMIPSRNASAIGNIFDADLSQFLMKSPCSDCLRISSIKMNLTPPEFHNAFSTLDITFLMRHPFTNIAARPDLHGFDVRLILIGDGFTYDYPGIMVTNPDGTEEPVEVVDDFLLNPDGFTSHYDELVTDSRYFIGGFDLTGNINPFLRFFEDYSVNPFDPQAPAGHNVIPVGTTTSTRTAIINPGSAMETLVFYAVADVAYGQSAVFSNRQNPQYYLPSFNRTEAWRAEYWLENNTISELDPTSSVDVVVQVFDWQQNASVDPEYPDPLNLHGIPESSNVLRVELNIPEYQDAIVTATVPESGNGTPDHPLQYRLTITNEHSSGNSAWGLLAIRDELYGSASPSGRVPIPESPAGFPYATSDIRDYTLYSIVHINYPDQTTPVGMYINGELMVFPNSLYANDHDVLMLAAHFMDQTGRLFDYAWDFDYDGVTFDVDGTDFPFQSIEIMESGFTNVGLRVRTNSVPPREYIYTIPVAVEGDWFDSISDSTNTSTTYSSRENSLAITNANYYIAYTRETAGKRDIWLTIVDKATGNSQDTNVTVGQAGSFYNPAIELIESGVNAGLYVAFTDFNSGDPNLYSMNGPVDGLTFTPGNYLPIANSTEDETDCCLFNTGTEMLAYYTLDDPVLGAKISVSSLDFPPTGWVFEHRITEPSTGDQMFPMVARDGYYNNIYVVWQDSRNLATTGWDIYMTSSPDGILFANGESFNSNAGELHDIYPSLAITGRQIGVAYMQVDPIASTSEVHVAIGDSSIGFTSLADYAIREGRDQVQTVPSIGSSAEGYLTVAYSSYSEILTTLTAHVVELVNEGGWTIKENSLLTQDAGTVPPSASIIYPCVVSRPIAGGVGVENLIVYRNFVNGNTDSTLPFPMRLGEIQTVGIITDGNEWEF